MHSINPALAHRNVEVMNFLNEVAHRYPNAISFAPGRPQERFFDVPSALELITEFAQARPGVRGADLADLGQYGRTNGVIGELIADLLRQDEGLSADAQELVVTVGAQEAMCLCLLTLCGRADDVALVVEPAYIGMSGAAQVLGIATCCVPSDDDGVDLIALEQLVTQLQAQGKRARLLYLAPDFANPSGVTTTLARRQGLLDFTRRHGIFVVEDHAYSYFRYEGERLLPLRAMAGGAHCAYIGSFSKSLFPGVRVGFVLAPHDDMAGQLSAARVAHEMSKVKSLLTVNTSPLCQAIVGGMLLRHGGSLQDYIRVRHAAMRENRDTLLAALEQHFPAQTRPHGMRWNKPEGGFFLTLYTGSWTVTDQDLLHCAAEYGVLWTPMSYFYLDGRPAQAIRLSFSYVTPEQIQLGIAAFARFVRARRD
ncbi:PLP-dependent aminotransferase family protein [Massilia sp. W12]|uniref:aminotransferase-like domain-containing protein n=1 Tax=Massilia sp. W12 TaxID=3126507 RepID=UPI0030D39C84